MVKRLLQNLGALEAIAFITGAALMMYELTASRMLAPTIGSSTYVWTSVIGVIIAALSVGYTIGGRLADKRVAILDIPILLLGTAGCMANTLLFAPQVLSFIASSVSDPRLQGLLASLLLFMPASLILGVISPYLVRLHTASLATTGTSVASLSALNAIGGILGTFCAGFIFFSYMGVATTMVLVCAIVIASSWLIQPKELTTFRLLATAALVLLCILVWAPKDGAHSVAVDTPSAHYRVIDGTKDGRPIRLLATGPYSAQSGIYLDNKNELLFDYTQKMAAVTAEAPQKRSILILGGGSLTQPRYLAKAYPSAHIDVVDIDPELTAIARKYFAYSDPQNVTVINADARSYINTNRKQYDIIYVDIYSDASIPFSVATKEYVTRLNDSLTKNGVVIANIIGGLSEECAPLLNGLHTTYSQALPFSAYLPIEDADLTHRQNIVAVYANQPLDWLQLPTSTQKPTATTAFTDDFAPLETLTQTCRSRS